MNKNNMTIVVGSDHFGMPLRDILRDHLRADGYEVVDMGVVSDEPVDYPDVAAPLAEYGVRVNAVCPGHLLDSPLWTNKLYTQYAERFGISEAEVRQRYIDIAPMKRPCAYEDVGDVVAFLASDQASYMTGQAINVTGGQEMR